MSVRTFIYRSSLLTLVMVFSCSANAEKGQNPPENGGAAPVATTVNATGKDFKRACRFIDHA